MASAVLWLRKQMSVKVFAVLFAFGSAHCSAQGPSQSGSIQTGTRFSGQVITSSGPAQRDARIELRSMTGQAVCSVYTDASGSFHCSDVVPGKYQLIVSAGRSEQTIDISIRNFDPEVTIRLADGKRSREHSTPVSISELMVPSKARSAFQRATERFGKADLVGARSELDKAIALCPRFAAALTLRGVLKMGSSTPQEAVQDFYAAIEVDRTYGLAYIGLASYRNAAGEFDEAMKILDRGAPYLTQMWQSHYELSKSWLGKRAFALALQEAGRASAMLGRDFPALCLIKAQAYVNLNNARAARAEIATYLKRNRTGPGVERLRQLLASLNAR